MSQNQFKKIKSKRNAQATMEFTFAMLVVVLLLIGMIQVMVWTGEDLANRRQAYEESMIRNLPGWQQADDEPYYYSTPVASAVPSNIFGDVEF
ncbi:MAG: hypothetical protein AB1650_04090 [Candidatus Omnitrophota bacterium]